MEQSETLKELAEINASAGAKARGNEELPVGADPVKAKEEVVAELAAEVEAPAAETEAETLITIGDREFKSQAEAIKYAESLERDKFAAEAYNQGIRETLALTQKPETPREEENFDEKFYMNPKEALRQVKEQAKQEALAVVDARDAEKAAWREFTTTYPELADSEKEVRRILQENWDVLGKITDRERAMKILATKTKAYFQDISDRMKPKTELSNRGGQVVSPRGSSATVVTPAKKDERVLTLAEQMRSLKGRA